jgi:molybdopterin molybdotransferase
MNSIPSSKKKPRDLITVEKALVRLFSSFKFPKMNVNRVEYVYLLESNGRVLAKNVHSPLNVPPFDRADRDGFAISSSDTVSASRHSSIYLKIMGRALQDKGRCHIA